MNSYLKGVLGALLVSMAVASCTQSFDEPVAPYSETINGIIVNWRSQITDAQKSAIREILENMVLVEGDYFVMGATPEQKNYARPNEYPNSYVKLSNYYINRFEVTDEQFNAIMGDTKTTTEKYASSMTLDEWKRFVEVLREMSSVKFNFPTEAQWEFAARGGKQSKGYIFPGSNNVKDICSASTIVGSDVPNELGLYNLGDLKSEWCLDYYGSLVGGKLLTDWVQTDGKYHVVRGGNFHCTIESEKYAEPSASVSSVNYLLGYEARLIHPEQDFRNCRVTSRSYHYDTRSGYVGCRLVLNL